jgi:hypothetical protein
VEKEQGQQQARLRAEFAAIYAYLTPGVWESAAVLVDRVVATSLVGRIPALLAESAHSILLTSSSAGAANGPSIVGESVSRTPLQSS